MSYRHDGISCDVCHRSGFPLRRYKCLICYDYDLCGLCFDGKRESNNHKNDHPMQCLITKSDYGTFYAGENNTELAFSYTCPICGKLGNNISTLYKHINDEHSDSNLEVICPICASLSEGNTNFQTKNLIIHINSRHSALINLDQECPPNVSRRPSKPNAKSIIEPPSQSAKTSSKNLASTMSQLKKMSTSNDAIVYNSQNQGSSNPNIISGTEMSEEPLLHSLLNQLYTWRTRRENMTSLNRNQSVPDSRTNQDNGLDTAALLNDDNAASQPCGLSRNSIKQTLQDRSKNLRRKLGTKNIIDLTENWKYIDPDNELFNFEDDLENITFSLNQASLHPNEMEDSEYFDEDDDIAWPQDIVSENIYNQLKSLTSESHRMGQNTGASGSASNPKSNSNNFFDSSKPSSVSSINYQHLPYFLTSDNHNLEFKLPSFATQVRSQQHNRGAIENALEYSSTVDDKKVSLNLAGVIGNQGFLVRDVVSKSSKHKKSKDKKSKPDTTSASMTDPDAQNSCITNPQQTEALAANGSTENDDNYTGSVAEFDERSQLARAILFSSLFVTQDRTSTTTTTTTTSTLTKDSSCSDSSSKPNNVSDSASSGIQ